MPVLPVVLPPVIVEGDLYCTEAQARARGATGSAGDVEAAIVAAMERIDTFTGDHFKTFTDTARLRVKGDWAGSQRRIQSVVSVERVMQVSGAAPTVFAVPALAFQVSPYGIRFASGGGDILIAGAEPWRGGWENLTGSLDGIYVDVEGVFGWPEVPDAVREAAALLAGDHAPLVWAPHANDEGDPIGVPQSDTENRTPLPEGVGPAGRLERTTGNAEADRLLAPYISSVVKVG